MKIYRKLLLSVGVLATVSLSSCDTKFNEINENPNDPVEVPTYGIMTTLQQYMSYNYYGTWEGLRMKGIMAQHWAQNEYVDEDTYNFSSRTTTIAGYFNDGYEYSELGNKIIQNAETYFIYGDPVGQIATTKILQKVLMLQNVETYGDVPYTQANKINEFPQPVYDSQIDIYKSIIEELKTIAADLKTVEGLCWTQGDKIYSGDADAWRKFANSLRLRTAMRLMNYDAAYATTEAQAAIADGVFESNADNAVFNFTGLGSPNEHPLYAGFVSRDDFSLSWQFVNLLQGGDSPNTGAANPFGGIVDPRLYVYALTEGQAETATEEQIKSIIGIPYGLDRGNAVAVRNALKDAELADGFNGGTPYIQFGPTRGNTDANQRRVAQPAFWSTYMDFANVSLLKAELNGNNAADFEAGVRASMEMWEIRSDRADAYVAAVVEKFASASEEQKKEMILTQKYIHNFAHFSQEALAEYVRTGYPASVISPNQTTGDLAVAEMIGSSSQLQFISGDLDTQVFIQRMMYPTTEFTTNEDNVKSAVEAIGGDTQAIPLIYSKMYKK